MDDCDLLLEYTQWKVIHWLGDGITLHLLSIFDDTFLNELENL